ncbi:hypothetical protein GCM10011517_19560 [Actibacterium pelagium]|uniref:Caspase family p20 domain-containing protein n=1 Tax=Actibacterium pelagium TaxID=2029103 RepID=A0A917AGV8_9RHOB|nr:hypothetical protein GCM10011517_19560 [Actibacterium pelagium]
MFGVIASAASAGERVALLIGNSIYDRPEMSLRNPSNDVDALGATLRALGFTTYEAVDQDLSGMEAALSAFADQANGAEMALFFYAGHGVQIGGDNLLIGTELQALDTDMVRRSSLPMSRVREALAAANPEIGILMLDACRNNPFSDAGLVDKGLVRTRGGVGLLVAYATDPGNVAYDGVGENSVFTEALLKHLSTPGIDLRLVLGRVRQQVVLETRGQQVPWVEEAVLGEHYLVPAIATTAGEDPFKAEIDRWRQIAASTDTADFQDYLIAFPDGMFASFASDRIKALVKPDRMSGEGNSLGLLASSDPTQVADALTALGLLPSQNPLTRAVEADLVPALDSYRAQLPDPGGASAQQLFTDATRVSMFLAATTLQRIRTDIVALRSVEGTLGIAEDALNKIRDIAEANEAAKPILEQAEKDVGDIRLARADILRRLDNSRSYYDDILKRAVSFVPEEASPALIGGVDRSRNIGQTNRQLLSDANLFLKHVKDSDEATKGSYSWLTDLISEN